MTAYIIYQAEVLDAEQYGRYREKAQVAVENGGGDYIVRGGDIEVLEGDAPPGRTVVLEFESMQAAHDWYHGPEYTAAKALREGAVRANAYIVDGVG